jgi:hypothetical protein
VNLAAKYYRSSSLIVTLLPGALALTRGPAYGRRHPLFTDYLLAILDAAPNPMRSPDVRRQRYKSPGRRASWPLLVGGASTPAIAAMVSATVLIVPHREAVAWSAYSSQTGLRCEQCHTRSGNLTQFGKKFKANGNKLPEPPGPKP